MASTSVRFPVMRTSARDISNPVLVEDVERLEAASGCAVDLLCEGHLLGVVVRSYALPAGIYSKRHSDLMLQTNTQYPHSAMDMFWVDEDLTLANGRSPAGGESIEVY